MIIYHQSNVATFAGNHTLYATAFVQSRISATSAGAGPSLIVQMRGIQRFVSSRIFGRIN